MGNRLAPWQSPPAREEQSGASERVWGRREFATGVTAGSIAGLIAAVFTVVVQAVIDDRREAQADRREDVRFVRQIAADGTASAGSLQNLDLSGSNLSGLNLVGANLSGADLSGSDLTGTSLTGATMVEVDLSEARLDQTSLVGADLSGAVLANAELLNPILGQGDWRGEEVVEEAAAQGFEITRQGLTMVGADLTGATIAGARFEGVNLERADFTGAVFEYERDRWDLASSLKEINPDGTKFYNTDLSQVILPGSGGFDADSRVFFSLACTNETTIFPEGYIPFDLRNDWRCEGQDDAPSLRKTFAPGP